MGPAGSFIAFLTIIVFYTYTIAGEDREAGDAGFGAGRDSF